MKKKTVHPAILSNSCEKKGGQKIAEAELASAMHSIYEFVGICVFALIFFGRKQIIFNILNHHFKYLPRFSGKLREVELVRLNHKKLDLQHVLANLASQGVAPHPW